jgi:hypothetical protein
MQTKSEIALVEIIRAARQGSPQHLTVWAFLRPAPGSDKPHAEPIQVRLRIEGEHVTTWGPIAGKTLDGNPIDLDTLNSGRVWWGGWPRRWAAAMAQVEQEQQEATDLAYVRAWINDEEVNGDRQVRVIREFPAPRGYGEGV